MKRINLVVAILIMLVAWLFMGLYYCLRALEWLVDVVILAVLRTGKAVAEEARSRYLSSK